MNRLLVFDMLIPLVLCGIAIYGMLHRVDVYQGLIVGAEQGLKVVLGILPALVALMTAVYMLRASGGMELLAKTISPWLERIGLPSQLLPLMLMRPVSGSAALGVGAELISTYGADSQLGRMAAVMLGSTETTFYVVAVYFGAVGVNRTRYAVPAALCADLAGFFASVWVVKWWFG